MIKTIRIQNFRSLKDVTLNLQDVNLLIGPNNSGKSNLLKAFEFLGDFYINRFYKYKKNLASYFFSRNVDVKNSNRNDQPIIFTITSGFFFYQLEIYGLNENNNPVLNQLIGITNNKDGIDIKENVDLNDVLTLKKVFYNCLLQNNYNNKFRKKIINYPDFPYIQKDYFIIHHKGEEDSKFSLINDGVHASDFVKAENFATSTDYFEEINNRFSNTIIYSVNISNLKKPYPTLEDDYSVKSDASNLVAFLDNMRDNKPGTMEAINASLNECIKEFKSISFEKVALPENHDLRKIYGDKTFKRLGVQDIYGQIYWADELSDGTLYFLALLAIIHQPNPPKLLMVEEPENGIHPRRIKELMDYFFEIAEKQGVQVIMTTHSTVVIDQFVDFPESVFVFDKTDQATTIKNLKTDIMAEDAKQAEKLNVPKLDLSQSLGDHWASGLIGGVPR